MNGKQGIRSRRGVDPNTHLRHAAHQVELASALLPRGTHTRTQLERIVRELAALTTEDQIRKDMGR